MNHLERGSATPHAVDPNTRDHILIIAGMIVAFAGLMYEFLQHRGEPQKRQDAEPMQIVPFSDPSLPTVV